MRKTVLTVLAVFICLVMSLQGAQKREKREIDSQFNGVELATHGELRIMTGDRVELFVEADDEVMPYIVTRVKGDTLVIERKSKVSNWLMELFRSRRNQRMRFTLTVLPKQLDHLLASSHGDIVIPELSGEKVRIELSSHGEVNVDEVAAESVRITLSSHGDLKVAKLQADKLRCVMSSHGLVRIRSGRVADQHVMLSSHGDYLAEGLDCDTANVELSSHGTAKVFARDRLSASITSHGDLYYRGSPEIDVPRSQQKRVHAIR